MSLIQNEPKILFWIEYQYSEHHFSLVQSLGIYGRDVMRWIRLAHDREQ
jgi:hypothetical protein